MSVKVLIYYIRFLSRTFDITLMTDRDGKNTLFPGETRGEREGKALQESGARIQFLTDF